MIPAEFSLDEVMPLVEHAIAAETFFDPYEGVTNKPALLLVGDHGVYLMSNGRPEMKDGDKNRVVHAHGCNPDKDDDWWNAKQDMFGGDDGVESLPLDDSLLRAVRDARQNGAMTMSIELREDAIAIAVK